MDIRFIDSRYKELFRIPNGGCVKINLNNGGKLLGKCKYIDDYHFTLTQAGRMYGETYHIRQFAEINERNGNTVVVLCQDNGHIKPLFFSKISKMHKLVAFIPRFA